MIEDEQLDEALKNMSVATAEERHEFPDAVPQDFDSVRNEMKTEYAGNSLISVAPSGSCTQFEFSNSVSDVDRTYRVVRLSDTTWAIVWSDYELTDW